MRTAVRGNTVPIASGKPVSPSTSVADAAGLELVHHLEPELGSSPERPQVIASAR